MKPLNVWITGARGFIGRHLARAISGRGDVVSGIGYGAWPMAESSRHGLALWLNGTVSVSNLDALAAIASPPDVVLHLAGGSSVGSAIAQPREDFDRTVVSTIELLEWLRHNSPTTVLVGVSSAAVYGAGHASPIKEDVRAIPYSPYGYHKLMLEQLCRSYGASFGIKSVVARLFSVYGSGLRKQLLWDLCSKLSRIGSAELGGSGNEVRDWVAVEDVINVLSQVHTLATTEAPCVNVGTGVATPVRTIAEMVARSWSNHAGTGSIPKIEFSGKSRTGDPFSLVASTEVLNRSGLACRRAVGDGIDSYVDWFMRAGEGAE